MKVIAAYLLAVLGGNASPSADDIKAILASVGAEVDEMKIDLLLSQVQGKDITELIAAGKERMATLMPAGGGGAAVVAGGCAASAAAVEAKEEEKVEEKEESDDDAMFGLFDD